MSQFARDDLWWYWSWNVSCLDFEPPNEHLILRPTSSLTPAPKLFCFGYLLLWGFALVCNTHILPRFTVFEVHSTKRLFRSSRPSIYFVLLNLGSKWTLVVFATSRSAQHTLSVPSWSLHSNLTLTKSTLPAKSNMTKPANKTGNKFLRAFVWSY